MGDYFRALELFEFQYNGRTSVLVVVWRIYVVYIYPRISTPLHTSSVLVLEQVSGNILVYMMCITNYENMKTFQIYLSRECK